MTPNFFRVKECNCFQGRLRDDSMAICFSFCALSHYLYYAKKYSKVIMMNILSTTYLTGSQWGLSKIMYRKWFWNFTVNCLEMCPITLWILCSWGQYETSVQIIEPLKVTIYQIVQPYQHYQLSMIHYQMEWKLTGQGRANLHGRGWQSMMGGCYGSVTQ